MIEGTVDGWEATDYGWRLLSYYGSYGVVVAIVTEHDGSIWGRRRIYVAQVFPGQGAFLSAYRSDFNTAQAAKAWAEAYALRVYGKGYPERGDIP